MSKEKLKSFFHVIANQYQRVENYFTSGSFGVKFYPILMYPCVRHSQTFIVKLLAVLSVFIGIYFLFAELIAILFSQSTIAGYLHHTLFELSLPVGTVINDKAINITPLSYVIRASFLVQGYAFAIIYLFSVMRITEGVRLIAGALAIAFSAFMVMIYSAEGGQFTVGGLQNIGVSITFLIGNLVLIITGLTVKSPQLKSFKILSLVLGVIGAAAVIFTIFEPTPYLPILERLSLYAILVWEIAVGFAILKQVR